MSADQVVAQDLAAAVFRDASMTETSGVALSTTAKASHATRKTSKSGVRREVAELMVDQQRRAANVEELAFFKQEAARLTQDNTSGTSVAERDDRGGRIGSPTSPDGVNSSQGGSAAILPAQHRWIMIPPEVATVVGRGDDDCVRQEVRGAWSWKRTDDAVEDAVLTYSAQMLEETESVTFSSLELSAALCYDGVWNGPTKRRGLKPTGDDDVRTFFSFTQEEYESLPSTPSPQLSSTNDDDEFVFDFASSHKLAVLYERFGNFEVVCDRWRWSDASGCQTSVTTPKIDWRKEGFPTSAEDGMAAPLAPPTTPSVGALCEEYQRLTEGILQLRLQRLTTIVEGGSTVEGCDGPHGAITSPNNAAPSSSVGRHPVVSMAAHHTFLGDGQSGEVTQETAEGADTDATPSSPVAPTLKRPREEVGEVAGRTSSNDVFAVLSTPIPWFSRQRLQQRQTLLRRLLAEESETNVPYQEAARKYTSLVDQAANIIQHLRGIGFEEEGQPPVELPALSPLPDVVVLRERGKKAERPVSESPTPANPRKIRGSVFSSEAMEDVRMEVEHLIPFNCARIQAAALAGWILAAPTLLPSDPAASNTDVSPDASGRGTDGAEGGGGAPSSASPSKSKTTLPLTACNRVYSHLGEAVLVSLPHTVPKIHREVEEVLEQQLLDDHRAMMENSASVFQHTADIRLLYTQNLELQRYVTRLESLSEGLRKVITDTDEAAKGMRV